MLFLAEEKDTFVDHELTFRTSMNKVTKTSPLVYLFLIFRIDCFVASYCSFSTSGNYIPPLLQRLFLFQVQKNSPRFPLLEPLDSECFYILSIGVSNNSLPTSSESFPLSQEAAASSVLVTPLKQSSALLFLIFFTEKLLKEPGVTK